MVAPLIIAGEILGATVLPMLIEAFTRPNGPTPDDQAKMAGLIERESMRLAQVEGINLDTARERIKAELGPVLEKGLTEDPGLMQSILTWGGGGIAGALGGRKLGQRLAGNMTRKAARRPEVMAKAAARHKLGRATPDGMQTELPPSHPARKAAPTGPPPGQRMLDRDPDLGAETYNDFADVDDILKAPPVVPAAAPQIVKPGGLAKLNAAKAKKPKAPAGVIPEQTTDEALADAAILAKGRTPQAAAGWSDEQIGRIRQLGDLRKLRETQEFAGLSDDDFTRLMRPHAEPAMSWDLGRLTAFGKV